MIGASWKIVFDVSLAGLSGFLWIWQVFLREILSARMIVSESSL